MPPVTLNVLYQSAKKTLHAGGIEKCDVVARDLVKRVLNVADLDIILESEQPVYSGKAKELDVIIERYLTGEPISRIFGERYFWSLPFKITPDVLDPRPDTETLIEAAIRRFFGEPPEEILDLGTGSGCIAITLLTEWPLSKALAVDISDEALRVTQHNARINKVQERLRVMRSNWCESVKDQFDVIVANPPYIANHEMPNLPPEVKDYDPILALQGGEDGLDCYKIIIKEIKSHLKSRGAAFLEVGFSQGQSVSRLVEDAGLFVNAVHPDSAGIPRVVEISFGEK